jgi:O-antigen ligase
MKKQTAENIFDYIFLSLFLILVIGTPLIFTSLTRSVFEVNKLLLLRLTTIITYAIWLFRYLLFKDNQIEDTESQYFSFFSFKWRKIGLEIPMLIWLGINILSTIFSQNIRIAIIGAYDRWEGIITITNYILLIVMFAKLIRKKYQLKWLIAGIIIPTALSSIYGVLQSLGFDFMHWSVDPTLRVFACINNPVHFCAYVSMVVPLGLSWLLFMSSKERKMAIVPKWYAFIKWSVFFCTALIYYAQFLSFSRATWMGFIGSMTLFYLITTNSLNTKNNKTFIIDFFLTVLGIASIYLLYIFRLHRMSPIIYIPIALIIVGYIIHCHRTSILMSPPQDDSPVDFHISAIGISLLCIFTFIFDFSTLHWAIGVLVFLLLVPIFLYLSINIKDNAKIFMSRLVIIIIFAKLQFVSISITSVFLYIVLLIGYYYLILKGNKDLYREKKFWLIAFLFIFGLVIVIPTVPYHVSNVFKFKTNFSLQAVGNVEGRVHSYRKDAIKGTARTSMWKSAIPWIKDYWVLGTGPDTIKYMYPNYRRSEYGYLEGGHNFTPDRLHNEYLNTLATRGLFGFLIYYFGIMVGWYIIILNGWLKMRNSPYRYPMIGFMAGGSIYLGQVLFNFGVVATIVLFNINVGLALAIIKNKDFQVVETDNNQDILLNEQK